MPATSDYLTLTEGILAVTFCRCGRLYI